MDYYAMIKSIINTAMAHVAYNQMSQAQEGYETQLSKYKTVEPVKPDDPKTVDWKVSLNDAIKANKATKPYREEDAADTNRFNTAESRKMFTSMQPYFSQLQSQVGQNAMSYSKGELPADVVSSIGRAAASRGLSSGFGQGVRGGGQGTSLGSLNLRNLGLTSLELSKYGTGVAMQANQMAKYLSPELADVNMFALGPRDTIGYDFANVGIENENARYWNDLLNKAQFANTGIKNQANQMTATGNLAARLAKSQVLANIGSDSGGSKSGGGGMGGMGGMMGGGGGGMS